MKKRPKKHSADQRYAANMRRGMERFFGEVKPEDVAACADEVERAAQVAGARERVVLLGIVGMLRSGKDHRELLRDLCPDDLYEEIMTESALSHLRARGVKLGGAALGWERTAAADSEGRRIVAEVQFEIATVKRIRALRAEGRTNAEIVAALKAEGLMK